MITKEEKELLGLKPEEDELESVPGMGSYTNGKYLLRKLKPAGCILVLILFAAFLLICFRSGADPIPGYTPAESTEYYSENPDALLEELEMSVFPQVEGIVSAEVSGDSVRVVIEDGSFITTRSALLHYFDDTLLELIKASEA